jgi:lysozyme family protein
MSLESALAFTLKYEGSYTNNPRDNGGATNYGITQRVFDAWQIKHGEPTEDVRDISMDTVNAIYEHDYWLAAHCDSMPDKLAMVVFDTAVNSGVGHAMRALQTCLGIGPDGAWGPRTLAAIKALDDDSEKTLVASYIDHRRDYCEDIVERNPGQSIFLRGWLARCDALEKEVS